MTFDWMSRLPSTRMFLLQRHEGDTGLGECVEDGHDLTQRPAEPREFADDEAVTALQDARQLVVEASALLGGLPEAVASMNSSMRMSFARAYSRMARRWLPTSCCGVETRR